MKKQKLSEPDILRTSAFLAVVAQHTLGNYAKRDSVSLLGLKAINIAFEFTRFAVPLFVFLFAAMQFYRYFDKLKYCEYLWKRVKQLLFPYIIWTALYLLYSRGIGGLNPKTFTSAVLFSNGEYHLWYVGMIFQFVIATPLLFAIVRSLFLVGTIRKRIIFIVLVFTLCMIYIGFSPEIQSNIKLVNDIFFTHRSKMFLSWLIYYFAGALCGLYYESFKKQVKRFWIPSAIIVIIILIFVWNREIEWVNLNGKANFSVVSFLNPGFSLVTLLQIILLFRISMAIAGFKLINKTCTFIGGVSYQAYLAHVMCINIINAMTVSKFEYLSVYYTWLYCSTVVSSLLIGYIAQSSFINFKKICIRFCNKKSPEELSEKLQEYDAALK